MKWKKVKLGDTATFVNGYAFKPSDWSASGREIIRIQNLTRGKGEVNRFNGEIPERYLVKRGDLLISWSATLGVYEWDGEEAWLNQHIFKVVFDKRNIDKRFFKYLIESKLHELERQVHGATMKHITKGKFDNISVDLPPLHIQQQIAATLDKADALRRKDQELLKKYDELAQSIFYDMFGDPVQNERGWEVKTIGDIAAEVKYGTSSSASESGQYPYLRMNNITYNGELDLTDLKYIDVPEKDYLKYGTRAGDLLFNRTNSKELVGKTTIVDTDVPMILAGYLIRVRFTDQADPVFVSSFLNCPQGKQILRGMCKSIIGMANINAQELQSISIIVPPIELQKQYAERFAAVKGLKKKMQYGVNSSTVLFNQIMQNFFSAS